MYIENYKENNENKETIIRENFGFLPSLSFKDMAMYLLILILKIFIFGYIIYSSYYYTGYLEDKSILNVFIFVLAGSCILYICTFLDFMFRCYRNNVNFSDMNYKGYALSSVMAPTIIVICAVIIKVIDFLKISPIGLLLQNLVQRKIYIILITGIVYYISFETAYALVKCNKNN